MNSSIKPILSNEFSFWYYKELVEKYISRDNRELNYQNRIIILMLDKLVINEQNIDIVDVSTQYKNWKRHRDHNRDKYAGNYTPDILIARNWDINNKDKKEIEYLCLIEVKVPTANDKEHASQEVQEYLDKVNHVILTDTITWEFYEKNKKTEIISLEKKGKPVCDRGKNKKIEWEIGEHKCDDFLKTQLGFPVNVEKEPENWGKIIHTIKAFLLNQ